MLLFSTKTAKHYSEIMPVPIWIDKDFTQYDHKTKNFHTRDVRQDHRNNKNASNHQTDGWVQTVIHQLQPSTSSSDLDHETELSQAHGHTIPTIQIGDVDREYTLVTVEQPECAEHLMIDNYDDPLRESMALSLGAIFFCCIMGLVATNRCVQARDYIRQGDYDAAWQRSMSASALAKKAIVVGVIIWCVGVFVNTFYIKAGNYALYGYGHLHKTYTAEDIH